MMIYEGTPRKKILKEQGEKKVNITKIVKFLCARWTKAGDINLPDIVSLGAEDFETEDKHELRDQLVPTIIDLLENEIQQAYTIHIPFQNADICFDLKNAPADDDYLVEKILRGAHLHRQMARPPWSDFIFNAIDHDNLSLLQAKCKVEHITPEYLEHEYPDLCHIISFDYYAGQIEKRLESERLYIIKEVMKIFDGCGIKVHGNCFIINAPISFLLKSPEFKNRMIIALGDDILYPLLNGKDVRVIGAKDVVYYMYEYQRNLSHIKLHQFTRRVYKELAGGQLPEFDCEKLLDTSINTDAFNKRVGKTILDFFK